LRGGEGRALSTQQAKSEMPWEVASHCFFWLNGVVSDDFSEIVRSSFAPFTITKRQFVCEFF
jgi:hypothetical protein